MTTYEKALQRKYQGKIYKAFIFPVPSRKFYINKHIPDALAVLPFKEQALDNKNFGADLRSFLNSLYNDNYITESAFNYRLKSSIKLWYKKILEEIEKDKENIIPAHNNISRCVNKKNLSKILKALKYTAAWKSIITWCLEEYVFFNLEYLLEIEDEIESSILLFSKFFYKQAFYSIRSFLEISLSYIFHSFYTEEYEKWRDSPKSKTLSFHMRKDSLISILKGRNFLSFEVATNLSKLYTKLNNYVHSYSDSIINRRIHRGTWIGCHFNPEFLLEWTKTFIDATEIMLKIFCKYLIKRSSNEDSYLKGKCPSCHESDFLEGYDPIFKDIYLYKCRKCNDIVTYYNRRRVNVVRNYEFSVSL